MVRCDEFYLKWDKCGNFCEKHPDTASEIEKYLDFQHEIENRGDIEPAVKAGISAISADALRPLLREPDPEIREETKTHVIKALKRKTPTGGLYYFDENGKPKTKKRKKKNGEYEQISPIDGVIQRTLKTVKGKYIDRERKGPKLLEQYNIEIRRGDFRTVLSDLSECSVKLILTDPPYGKKYLSCWEDLGAFAARVLRDDGALITYSGQLYLPKVIESLLQHLDWWWLCAVVHAGSSNLTPLGHPVRKVINQFKPILMFVPRGGGIETTFRDLVNGTGPEKDKHNWAQPVGEAYSIIQTFCEPGDLIVDPFAGSGSVGVAAKQLGMKFIGAEILEAPNGQT